MPTPPVVFIPVWFEADDIGAIFELLATRTGEDADWMRGRIKDVTGLDLTEPAEAPLPDVILEWPA